MYLVFDKISELNLFHRLLVEIIYDFFSNRNCTLPWIHNIAKSDFLALKGDRFRPEVYPGAVHASGTRPANNERVAGDLATPGRLSSCPTHLLLTPLPDDARCCKTVGLLAAVATGKAWPALFR